MKHCIFQLELCFTLHQNREGAIKYLEPWKILGAASLSKCCRLWRPAPLWWHTFAAGLPLPAVRPYKGLSECCFARHEKVSRNVIHLLFKHDYPISGKQFFLGGLYITGYHGFDLELSFVVGYSWYFVDQEYVVVVQCFFRRLYR